MAPVRLLGHPVHPMLVHFPVALWALAFPAELAAWVLTPDPWAVYSFACQGIGVAIGLAALVVGFADYLRIAHEHPAQSTARRHMLVMCGAWLLFLYSLALRGWPVAGAPSAAATAVAATAFTLMIVGCAMGGRLVYHFGVGSSKPNA